MKKKLFVKITAAILAVLLFVPCFSTSGSAAGTEANPIKKIGLKYGSSGVRIASLQNYTGYGFNLGYFDSKRTFISITSTSEKSLSVTCDMTFDLSSSCYTDEGEEKNRIGGWHLQSAALTNAAAAVAEAKRIQDLGRSAAPAYIDGKYYVRTGHYASEADVLAAKESTETALGYSLTAVGNQKNVLRVTVKDKTEILFYFRASCGLGISPGSTVPAGLPTPTGWNGVCQTWFNGYRYYGGFEYLVNSSSLLTVINVVDLVSYVKGVIPYEISASWPIEAQKAQALCAKCYAHSECKHSSSGFDLCNTACCQVYRGNNAATSLSDSAVDAIANKTMSYEGKQVKAYYSSADGGATEDSENVWANNVGYLRGKKDIYEDASMIPNYTYTNTITAAEVASQLRSKGYAVASVKDMYISKYTAMGNVYTLTVVDGDGKQWNFSKASARTVLGTSYVKSQRFTVSGGSGNKGTVSVNGGVGSMSLPLTEFYVQGGSGNACKVSGGPDVYVITGTGTVALGDGTNRENVTNDTFTVTGTGSGHNVGMSQWGLYCGAKKGATYDEMLKFYYTGITVSDLT